MFSVCVCVCVCVCSVMAKARYVVCYSVVRIGPDSEEHFEGQLCALSFSMLQTDESISMNISRRSPVATLLVSCASGGELKSSEAGAAIIKEGTW